jgi:hypothetical protein
MTHCKKKRFEFDPKETLYIIVVLMMTVEAMIFLLRPVTASLEGFGEITSLAKSIDSKLTSADDLLCGVVDELSRIDESLRTLKNNTIVIDPTPATSPPAAVAEAEPPAPPPENRPHVVLDNGIVIPSPDEITHESKPCKCYERHWPRRRLRRFSWRRRRC